MNHYYSENGIGLVFTPDEQIEGMDEISYLLKSYSEGEDEVLQLASELEEIFNGPEHWCRYYDNEVNADKIRFTPFANIENTKEPTDMLVIEATKYLKPFEAAYPDGPDEIRKEFQDLLGEHLPKDFDWDAHIGWYDAAFYG